jgi:hypothetical protein
LTIRSSRRVWFHLCRPASFVTGIRNYRGKFSSVSRRDDFRAIKKKKHKSKKQNKKWWCPSFDFCSPPISLHRVSPLKVSDRRHAGEF